MKSNPRRTRRGPVGRLLARLFVVLHAIALQRASGESGCLEHFFDDLASSVACQARDAARGVSARECQACVHAKWDSHLASHCGDEDMRSLLMQFCAQSAAVHAKKRLEQQRPLGARPPQQQQHGTPRGENGDGKSRHGQKQCANKTCAKSKEQDGGDKKWKKSSTSTSTSSISDNKKNKNKNKNKIKGKNKNKNKKTKKIKKTKKRGKKRSARQKARVSVSSNGDVPGSQGSQQVEDQSAKLELCLSYFFRDLTDSAGCQDRDEIRGVSSRECRVCVEAQWAPTLRAHCNAFGQSMLENFCDQSAAHHEKWRKDPSSKRRRSR
eukprot:g1975.t1